MEVVMGFTATTLSTRGISLTGPHPPLHRNQFGGSLGQYKPFTTLWFAVIGKMLGGRVVNHQTITREEALIAHTRSNSYFVMHENELGSIQPGLAGLVMMDRDYLTLPSDQIKKIKPVITMVGGKVVHDAAALVSSKRYSISNETGRCIIRSAAVAANRVG
jgi:hypothetical protein